MFLTKMHLPRRTFLRGLGTTLALPLLDAMVPARTLLAQTAAAPVRRLNIVYYAHGMVMEHFTPPQVGADPDLPPLLRPLESFKDQLVVVSGLGHAGADTPGAGHAGASAAWLTGTRPRRTEAENAELAPSADQIAARQIGQATLFPSLELATEDFTGRVGACDVGYSCTYINTLSWAGPSTPLPNETNPRVLFERLFGEGSTSQQRLTRLRERRSILDGVRRELAGLQASLAGGDRAMVQEYLDHVREIERRIQVAEQHNVTRIDVPGAPVGVPDSYEEHIKLMFDLQLLAFQADLTRVSTFVLSRELTQRAYPDLGVSDPHHTLSHHQNDPAKIEKMVKIQAYQMGLFAYYLDRLRNTPDGDGSLLDHMLILHGSGMADSNAHWHHSLPLLLVGGASGQMKGNRHLSYSEPTPMANLLVSLVEKVGGETEQIGDSTGRLSEL